MNDTLLVFLCLVAFFTSLEVVPVLCRLLKNIFTSVRRLLKNSHLYGRIESIRQDKKMKLIKQYFEAYFSRWQIKLPVKTFNKRINGYIHHGNSGWLIQYCFGVESALEYMDFYAYNNMTNDRHIRIYENGEAKDLPAYWSGYFVDSNGSGKRAYEEHNAEVTKALMDKGFYQFTINMAISAFPSLS